MDVSDSRLLTAAMLLVERASADAVAALRGAGIRSILLKGPLHQGWLAPARVGRASVDVDLLLDHADVDAAGKALSALGYRREPEVTPGVEHHADRWTTGSRVPIEVHWNLWGTEPARTWRVLEAETESTELLGEMVEIPNEPARCLIAALHAAHHGAGEDAPLNDLQSAISVAPRAVWQRAATLAAEVGVEAEFAVGLGLVPPGERLRADLDLHVPQLTERLALNLSEPVQGAAGFYWLGRQHGVRAKARFVARKLFPPADFMRFKYRFAREGRGRLALAYIYRLLWIAGRTLPGFLSWRRSRREARATRRAPE
jgi:hypothetical protein